jgi:hypothetical protein
VAEMSVDTLSLKMCALIAKAKNFILTG